MLLARLEINRTKRQKILFPKEKFLLRDNSARVFFLFVKKCLKISCFRWVLLFIRLWRHGYKFLKTIVVHTALEIYLGGGFLCFSFEGVIVTVGWSTGSTIKHIPGGLKMYCRKEFIEALTFFLNGYKFMVRMLSMKAA